MKILVIEDEPNNMMLITIILKKYGHEPIEAFTGEEGLEKAAASRPDLILMDIRLPGIDGFETTSRIRKMENMLDVPIIAVTSYAMADDLKMIKKMGFNGFLEKPIDPLTINDKIMRLIKETK
ncbi:MAG TPA: response regulator [Candidatus Methanoperedens sp.]|jgi:two-component system cell cycle response regulator DivK